MTRGLESKNFMAFTCCRGDVAPFRTRQQVVSLRRLRLSARTLEYEPLNTMSYISLIQALYRAHTSVCWYIHISMYLHQTCTHFQSCWFGRLGGSGTKGFSPLLSLLSLLSPLPLLPLSLPSPLPSSPQFPFLTPLLPFVWVKGLRLLVPKPSLKLQIPVPALRVGVPTFSLRK